MCCALVFGSAPAKTSISLVAFIICIAHYHAIAASRCSNGIPASSFRFAAPRFRHLATSVSTGFMGDRTLYGEVAP